MLYYDINNTIELINVILHDFLIIISKSPETLLYE